LKETSGRVVADENGIADTMQKYMKNWTNDKNQWDHKVLS